MASVSDAPDGYGYVPTLGMVRVYRPRVDTVPPPAGLSATVVGRRRLAERIADWWASAEPTPPGRIMPDFVQTHSVYVPASVAPLVGEVIATAPQILAAAMGTPDVRLYSTGYTYVLLLHAPRWSLVMEYTSLDTMVRICGDELGEWAIAADEERDPRVAGELAAMEQELIETLRAHSIGDNPCHRDRPAD